jgi:hypothetical protein
MFASNGLVLVGAAIALVLLLDAGLVITGMAFFGSVMVIIANSQARRFTGNLVVLGPAYFELMIREFGPLAAAILAAARTGAASAAELGSMSVNEQLEALELSSGDTLAELVAPRVVAGAIALPVLCTLGTLSAAVAAALTAQWGYDTMLDGKELPMTGSQAGQMAAVRMISERVAEITYRRDGRILRQLTNVLSPDGNTLAIIYMNFGADGKPDTATFATYERMK